MNHCTCLYQTYSCTVKTTMKRKTRAVVIKTTFVSVLLVSVALCCAALIKYSKEAGVDVDAGGLRVAAVEKRDVAKSVYRYRLPLSGQVGKIHELVDRRDPFGNRKKHVKKHHANGAPEHANRGHGAMSARTRNPWNRTTAANSTTSVTTNGLQSEHGRLKEKRQSPRSPVRHLPDGLKQKAAVQQNRTHSARRAPSKYAHKQHPRRTTGRVSPARGGHDSTFHTRNEAVETAKRNNELKRLRSEMIRKAHFLKGV